MAYAINTLQSVADCDELLTLASREKRGMEIRKNSLEFRNEELQVTSSDFGADLAKLQAELDYINDALPNMPKGARKEEMITDQILLTGKLRQLNARKENFGPIGLLRRQLDVEMLGNNIDEIDVFIQEINNFKSTL